MPLAAAEFEAGETRAAAKVALFSVAVFATADTSGATELASALSEEMFAADDTPFSVELASARSSAAAVASGESPLSAELRGAVLELASASTTLSGCTASG